MTDLNNGVCPSDIIYPQENAPGVAARYGAQVSYAELASYWQREVDNCSRQLESGNTKALQSLVKHWHFRGDAGEVARTYKRYLKVGNDTPTLGMASASLFRIYSAGERGVPVDPAASFKYLGLAVKYGRSELKRNYADELYNRGLDADAFKLYYELAAGISENQSPDPISPLELCEVKLRLGDMYFHGMGTNENWYLGYYFWQRGLAVAGSPRWGSCVEDNFIYGGRYDAENRRRKSVEERIGRLTPGEVQLLKRASQDASGRGLREVAAMSFERRGQSHIQRPLQTGRLRMQSSWMPLDGEFCTMKGSNRNKSWSEVFELRSNAIWRVMSAGASKISRGSAVAVSATSLVTNCHLLESHQTITLRRGNAEIPARLAALDSKGDRCILQVDDPLPSYVTRAKGHGRVKIGEDVAAIGNPKGLNASLSRGIVAQKRSRDGLVLLQTDTALSMGSSGGGLFDSAGNLVGITTFTIASGESLNFAIAIDEFCRL
ncbi:MAG: hypothetical protein HOC23_01395 [Halieaceae bacterium]|nr:hypothetical protein [Halieaceae bacterium]